MSDAPPRFYFEPLGDQHNRAAFSCGSEALDRYFTGDPIRQDRSRGIAAPFVMTHDGSTVVGFYTLSSLSVNAAELPPGVAKKLPLRLPIPAILLERMGVATPWQKRGLGADLLIDALRRALLATESVASWAVIVDAKEGARNFYLRYGFVSFPETPDRLFLPMKTIAQLF